MSKPRPPDERDKLPSMGLLGLLKMVWHLLKISFGSTNLVPPPAQKPKR